MSPWLCSNKKAASRHAFLKKPASRLTSCERESKRRWNISRVFLATPTDQGLYVTQRLNKLLVAAPDEATKLSDAYVSVEHLVLGMFAETPTTGIVSVL